MARRDAVIKPLQFRFIEPSDAADYGDDWHTYDELGLITKDARSLMTLEAEIGAPLTSVMNGVRESSVFGDTCAAWLGLREEGRNIAFEDFNPITMLIQWRVKPVDSPKDESAPTPEGEAGPTPALSEAPDSPTDQPSSGPLATVALPTMPISESPTL